MEFVEGRDLEQLLASTQHSPNLREGVEIIRSCCQALAVAADRNITHRDIKPANIMVDLNGTVKVMDFGLARISDDGQNKLTMEGTVMGTPNYMPPEQGLGEAVDPRADQYSLGCVMYEMLAGQPVFSAQSMAQILYKHIYEQPKPLASLRPDLPPKLAEICHKMIAKRREERYPHPTDILHDLDQVSFPATLPVPDLRSKVRAARSAATSAKPPKDTRALSMELSQDMTLMSLVQPLEAREPMARTQGGDPSNAQTLLTRGPSNALSMAGGGALEREETMATQKTVIRKTDAQRPVNQGGQPGSALSLITASGTSTPVVSSAPMAAVAPAAAKSNKGLVIVGVLVAVVALGAVVAFAVGGGSHEPQSPTPIANADGVLVPFSQLPKPGKGVTGKLNIDGLESPQPPSDRTLDTHHRYALVYSKPGYEAQTISLKVDASGVQPAFKSIQIALKPGAEIAKNYTDAVAKQQGGQLAEAKALFEKVVQVDPDYQDAQTRLNELSGAVAAQANASQKAIDTAQQAIDAKQWASAIKMLEAIPAADPLSKQARDLTRTAREKQDALDTLLQQIGLDLANGKFSDVDTKLISAGSLAPKEDPALKDIGANLKSVRDLIDAGTKLYLDQKYNEARDPFEKALKIAPNADAIKDKLRKIDMALKPTGETGKLIQEVKDAVTAANFTKAGERLKQIPDEFQDIPMVQDLNAQVLAGLNRKSIEDFLVSFDKSFVAGDEREVKRHLTLRPEGELETLEKALTNFDKELKFNKSEHRIVKLAFLDRGGRQAKLTARWRYDAVSLPYQAKLKGELSRDITIALEQGQWEVTAIKTVPVDGGAQGADQGGEAQPNVVDGIPAQKRLVGRILAVTPQQVTTGADPAKLQTVSGENTVTISVKREDIDRAMQGKVSGKLVFDVYTPDKVVSFPLSNLNAVIDGKYIGSLRVDVPGDVSTVCVVQAGKFDDFKPEMVAVQSTARTGLPKLPSSAGVAVSQAAVAAGTPVAIKVTTVNPESNVVHYNWTATGGRFRFERTDIATNLWFPPVQPGKYKIRVEVESAFGQQGTLSEITLESRGPDVDHRPSGLLHFDATHQPGFGKMLGLCFDEVNRGWLISQNEKSYTFTQVTSGLAKVGDVSLMREDEALSLKILVNGDQVYMLDRKANTVTSAPMVENLFAAAVQAKVTYGGQGQGAGKFQSATDFVVTPLSEVAILDATSRTVSLFAASGQYIMSFGSFGQAPGQLDRPVGLAVDGRGHCFVLDAGRKVVIHFDGGRMVREIQFDVGAEAKNQKLSSLAIDIGTGRLYVLDTGLSRVYAVDTVSGQWLKDVKIGEGGSGLEALLNVQSLAVDRTGRLYVVSAGGTVVEKFAADGRFLGKLDSTPSPEGTYTDLAMAPDGTGYLLNKTDKTVARLSADGLMTDIRGRGYLKTPVAVACDGAGNLLVLDLGLEGGCVARIDPAGKPLPSYLAGKCSNGSDLSAAGGKLLVICAGKGL
ncbi:MAG TPA: protein kinase, partial [Planctomycetota bacterium]|nr:protein kinase [Planctomycetota bacterium]